MTNKIRLKEMSHKKLRKLCKGLGRQCADYSKENGILLNSEAKKVEEIAGLKRYATSLEKTLASEARRIREKNEKLEEKNKRIEDLQQSNTSLLVKQKELRDKITDLEHALDALGNGMTMGVDGQLRSFNELSDEEHAAWVAREVARVQQENFYRVQEDEEIEKSYQSFIRTPSIDDEEGNCIGHTTVKPTGVAASDSQRVDTVGALFGVPQADGYIPKSANVDEAVEWAKRNGHHQPEGNPEPNKMDSVKFKSADEISAENKQKHLDMVCNEIQQDASRILNVDPIFDEKGKSHQSLD